MAEDEVIPRPSFAGRLRVADFMYVDTEKDTAVNALSPSKSPRAPGSPAVSPVKPSPRSSPRSRAKRKLDNDKDAFEVPRTNPSLASLAPAAAVETSRSPTRKGPRSKTRNAPSKYAPPSTYAHLPLLPDALGPNLLVLFVGLNPGIETARSGHSYAHPSNLFWKLMYSSGVLPERCTAQEDRSLPARFQLGLTNIVARPSRNGAELRASELDDGVAILEVKARRWRPEVMCMVGKGIWDSVVRVRQRQRQRQGDAPKPVAFQYGWQDDSENMGMLIREAADKDGEEDTVNKDIPVNEDGVRLDPHWKGARVFVASSTSGLAATLLPAQKEAIWRQLGEWVQSRRKEIASSVSAGENLTK
ncbi:uracil DNA N-glycosylase Thp1 [Sporothrix epigloea]|uniref:Uracil DNA N-glycosylase Thp1 n=1 Tax=Sporothrix epigloea TaxID=1892477 RepID=A0ABP0DLV2_9PEZI